MKYIFLLSGENIHLAKDEVTSILSGLSGSKNSAFKLYHRLLLVECSKKQINSAGLRLAFTRSIHNLLFSCKTENLEELASKYDWSKVYKKNFCMRIIRLDKDIDKKNRILLSEKELSSIIWNILEKKKITPAVNLENPKTAVNIFVYGNDAFVCLLEKTISADFEKRHPALRPGFSPVSLSPKLARAIVNLTGAKTGERITDSFCGTGGILIEAGLMGIKTTGYDIDEAMLGKCRKNLEFYKIKNYSLKKADATKTNKKMKYAVTDLPYGKSSRVTADINALYLAFLKNLEKNLVKKAVVIFPSFVDYKKIIRKIGLKIENEYSDYIHKSLTKKIVVLMADKPLHK